VTLRSCYFCGAVGRTVQPRPVSGVEVTLCPGCEDKLARLRAATDDGSESEDAVTGVAPVTFDGPDEAEPAPSDSGGGADDEPTDGTDGPGEEERADAENREAERTDEAETPSTGTAAPDDEDPDGRTAASDDASATGLRGLDADDRGRRSTYRKALRLLRNREFPMARADTVELLASAYDLDREECERLLDLCVDRGLLAEENGELREP
jgi:hypothetical protein